MSLPLPPHHDPGRVEGVWRVDYAARAADAAAWARAHGIAPSAGDATRVCLLLVDVQNTFCQPGFELFVGGRSGRGAIEDCARLSSFVYRNLDAITEIWPTLDTHGTLQIFHPMFLVDEAGEHPAPYTTVEVEDVERGRWRVDPAAAASLGTSAARLDAHLLHYCRALRQQGKYALVVWPYHAMLGGVGHALVSAVEEAVFFHSVARRTAVAWHVKGNNPLTENYSVLRPEVLTGPEGQTIASPSTHLVDRLLGFDAVIVAGQAKSHCVAWTIEDLLRDRSQIAGRVYLLEDCTSPVVVPGVADFTDAADAAFARFAAAGVHVVRSTEPIASWPGPLAGGRAAAART